MISLVLAVAVMATAGFFGARLVVGRSRDLSRYGETLDAMARLERRR